MRLNLILSCLAMLAASECHNEAKTWPQPSPIDGHERLTWEQEAPDIQNVTFNIYVDGVRGTLADAACEVASTLPTRVYRCSARMPRMSAGVHKLELSATKDNLEGSKSEPLLVNATGPIT